MTDIALGENIVTFTPGMKEGSVKVFLVDDEIAEQTEFANLELSIVGDPPRDIGLRISKSTIRILDNESKSIITIDYIGVLCTYVSIIFLTLPKHTTIDALQI